MFCLSLEESVGIPWAITCALLLVAVICHSDPTALVFVWAHQMEVINGFKWGVILISSNPNQFVESNQVLCQFQGSLVTTSVRFDNMREQILKQSVATEASYSQVRSLLISLRVLAVPCFLCATSGESCSRKCP